jgi:hypothetical protein
MIQQTGNVGQKKTEEIKLELFKPIVMAMVIFVHYNVRTIGGLNTEQEL